MVRGRKRQAKSSDGLKAGKETKEPVGREAGGKSARVATQGLLQLPVAIIGRAWPAERVLIGRRACKHLHKELLAHVSNVVLFQKHCRGTTEEDLIALFRGASNSAITLRWKSELPVLVSSALLSGVSGALRHLELQVGDGEVESVKTLLCECTALQNLHLTSTWMGTKGAESIVGVLSQCSTLTHLAFSQNGITEMGSIWLSLGEGLTHLDLSGNKIERSGTICRLLEKCSALAHLRLSGNPLQAPDMELLAGAIAKSSALTSLQLRSCYSNHQASEKLLSSLRACTALRQLDLSKHILYDLREQLAALLGELRGLERLELSACWLAGNIANVQTPALPTVIRALTDSQSLTYLDLSENGISERSVAGLHPLGTCEHLATLLLTGSNMKAGAAEELARLLPACSALTHLGLRKCSLGAAELAPLSAAVSQCKALAKLELSDNDVGEVGAKQLAGALAKCGALTHLDLSKSNVAKGAQGLAGGLAQCRALECLDLSGNKLGPGGGVQVARALRTCEALRQLDLRATGIGSQGATELAGSLLNTSLLTRLDLRQCGIGAPGAQRLAAALGECRRLDAADLRMNYFGKAEASSLREAAGDAVLL